MPGVSDEFARLARRLKEAGEGGLRRELDRAIDSAAQPVARQIGDVAHLKEYMPDRYAEVLAPDLSVRVSKIAAQRNPGVYILARAKPRERKVRRLNSGVLEHPLFGDRGHWYKQVAGVRAGFFTDPAEHSAPRVREAIESAMVETARKIMEG